jgi:hypothetical protein
MPRATASATRPVASAASSNLLRADPVARALDHRIAPPDEIEQAVCVAPDPVARPHRHAAIARFLRRGLEPLGGALGILPVTLRHQRPAMDQFALLAVPAICPASLITRISACGIALPIEVGWLSISAGSRKVERKASVSRTSRTAAPAGTGRAAAARDQESAPRRCWSAAAGFLRFRPASPARPVAPTAAALRPAW